MHHVAKFFVAILGMIVMFTITTSTWLLILAGAVIGAVVAIIFYGIYIWIAVMKYMKEVVNEAVTNFIGED